MAKARKFIPGTLLASVLSVPAASFAHDAGSPVSEQVRVPVRQQNASYLDRATAAAGYPMDFACAKARMQAQQQAFEQYGGMRSSSEKRSSVPPASGGGAISDI
ncbi:hypothetical protein F4827_003534 [Paraburkholderia bannensis]|uniref:DUF4148 domain-containing protein n=1 Tax=Paraburkholderia bannensis TaxID=765414 RepID=A0A7W9WTK0_9BURK|nr:hypothetical protein [Paraburkholderia sp. WP4_3_2]MBB6103679.1 hypothetical protein [Paraburkholderia bannensis]